MAPVVPTVEPTQVRAGESWLWDAAFGDYPRSEGWGLTYELRGIGRITLDASLTTANGDGWHVIVPATTTATYPADTYEFIAVLTGSGTYAGRVYHLPLPRLQVLPNLVLASAGARVSFAQAELVKVEAAIAARQAGDEPEFYSVDASSAKVVSLRELYAIRLRLLEELRQLRAPDQFGRQINHRFTRASA